MGPRVIMKLFIALSALLAVACAQATYEDCEAVVNTIAAQLTSEESINRQVEVLLAEVCPLDEHPEDCVAGLPDLGEGCQGHVAWILGPKCRVDVRRHGNKGNDL